MFRVNSCSSSGESILSIQHLVYVTLCRWPFRVQVGNELSDLHKKGSPTQNDIHQMYWYNWFSWWWARGCSKHLENWNKYIENNCASSWPVTKNYNEKHGQQNIKFCIRTYEVTIPWLLWHTCIYNKRPLKDFLKTANGRCNWALNLTYSTDGNSKHLRYISNAANIEKVPHKDCSVQ
jgi:hypothetical protein